MTGKLQLEVMLVEDHVVLREILADFIGKLPQVTSCTSTGSAEAALELIGSKNGDVPDLMLIDLSLPGMSGIELIGKLRKNHPALRCAILSGHRSRTYAGQALEAGASGYLLKGDPLEIERGILAIFKGQKYVSRSLAEGH